MTKKEIEKLKKFSKGDTAKILLKYIKENIDILKDISNIEEETDLAIEVKARKRAISILSDLFRDISLLREEEDFQRNSEYE